MSSPTIPTFRPRHSRLDPPCWREASLRLMVGVFVIIRIWVARRHARRELLDLAERGEEHLLADIGLTREDALRRSTKWFWQC